MQVIRIYFEYRTKGVGLTFWQRFRNDGFAYQVIRLCKEHGIRQAICFSVTLGYLNQQRTIHWGAAETHSEYHSPRHPQCIEIMDKREKIDEIMEILKPLCSKINIYMMERQEIINIKNNENTDNRG